MVTIEYDPKFKKKFLKIKDKNSKDKVKKQIYKIIENPEMGKPMKYERKGTRELYTSPFRIAYSYDKNVVKILFLNLYHKDEQ